MAGVLPRTFIAGRLATERVQARLDAAFNASDEQPGADYFRAKATMYLRIGGDAYRATDAFHQPDIRLSPENLEAIERGVAEIANGHGFVASKPLTDLPTQFSHSLVRLFHFDVTAQAARRSGDGLYFLDALLCRHVVDRREIVLFNRIPGARLRVQGETP